MIRAEGIDAKEYMLWHNDTTAFPGATRQGYHYRESEDERSDSEEDGSEYNSYQSVTSENTIIESGGQSETLEKSLQCAQHQVKDKRKAELIQQSEEEINAMYGGQSVWGE